MHSTPRRSVTWCYGPPALASHTCTCDNSPIEHQRVTTLVMPPPHLSFGSLQQRPHVVHSPALLAGTTVQALRIPHLRRGQPANFKACVLVSITNDMSRHTRALEGELLRSVQASPLTSAGPAAASRSRRCPSPRGRYSSPWGRIYGMRQVQADVHCAPLTVYVHDCVHSRQLLLQSSPLHDADILGGQYEE